MLGKRSSRVIRKTYIVISSDDEYSNSGIEGAEEMVEKFSNLQTRSRRSQRLIKTPKKYGYSSSDHTESQTSEKESQNSELECPKTPGKRGRKKADLPISEKNVDGNKTPGKRVRSKKIKNSSDEEMPDEPQSESDDHTESQTSEKESQNSELECPKTPGKRGRRKADLSTSEKNVDGNKTPGKRGRPRKIKNSSDEEMPDEPQSESDDLPENIEKPSEVLFEGQNVSGKHMFGFKSNKKRGGLAQRVFEAVNSPLRPLQNSFTSSALTPSKKLIRQKMKEKVAELEIDTSFEDFSDSGSEYKGSDVESNESESLSEENEDSDQEFTVKTPTAKKNLKAMSSVARNNKNHNYIMQSDDYFSWQASSKIITSNHTLQKLKNPKLSEDQLQELLSSNLNQSEEHESAIHNLFKYSCTNFNKWLYILHEGFNILLYGLGSKRNILKAFHKEILRNSPVLVVNGYFPSLTIKDITDSILVDIFEVQNSPSNAYEAVELIEKQCKREKNTHLYVIVHNIDGPMLRNNKSQNVLSSLADIPNVHLIGSIDHINTPLIWDHYKLSKFNFTWWDVTSFLPYSDETSFESSMLVQRSGALALSSLSNVYQSLTKNSKGIFMLIVKHQLNNKSVKYYQGMPFKTLYSQCREHFLVSSDLALRTQLTEFLDHKLVKSKRTSDGVEQLVIPINNSLLQQFVDQQK